MKFKLFSLCVIFIAAITSAAAQDHDSPTPSAPSSEKGLIKITIMYPFIDSTFFDMDYYETKHMPMVAGFLGSNLVKYTIEKGVASGIPNQPLPYVAIGTFYVKSLKEYQEAIAPNRDKIRADFVNYTNVAPAILVSEVVR